MRTATTISLGSLMTLATIILAVLKLTGVISISWMWVFAPVLFTWAFALLMFAVAALCMLVVALLRASSR